MRLLGAVVTVLALSSVSATATVSDRWSQAAGRCSNPLFSAMEPSIEVYNTPISYSQSTCGGLWNKTGLCCDESSLRNWARSDAASLNETAVTFQNLITNLSDKLERMTDEEEKVIEMQDLKFLKKMKKDGRVRKYSEYILNCNRYLTKARSNSLCSLCSADFRQYIYHEKAVVNMQDCNNLISNCLSYLFVTGNLLYGVKEMMFKGIIHLTDGLGREIKESSHELIKYLETDELTSFIALVEDRFINGNLNQTTSRRICEKSFNLVKPTFFQQVFPVLKFLLAHFEDFIQLFKESPRNLKEVPDNSRTLDCPHHSDELRLLRSDIKVLETIELDMFRRSNGRSVVQDLSHLKPVNLTLSFP